ncbi:MAG: DUF4349 domain-containing protein [Acidobacteriales bacterium]|nr:DUF4349 domain-containing protein [Terriglobales bacterium]
MSGKAAFKTFLIRAFTTVAILFAILVVMGVVRESRLQERYHRRFSGAALAMTSTEPIDFNDPIAMWSQTSLLESAGLALKALAPIRNSSLAAVSVTPPGDDGSSERKIVSVARLSLIVKEPREAVERIRQLAVNLGGYTAKLQIEEKEESRSAAMSIRVPASSLEQVRSELRKLSQRVESDSVEAEDVGKRYVDYEASLRNSRAEEAQYLKILQRAQKVSEILEVSEKLGEARAEVEKTEGELRYLQQQIALAAIAIALRTESDAEVAAASWRPLYTLKRSFRSGLDNIAGYAETMVSLVMNLPAILLWLGTIVLLVRFGWRLLRWLWRGVKTQNVQPNTAS